MVFEIIFGVKKKLKKKRSLRGTKILNENKHVCLQSKIYKTTAAFDR